MVAGGVVVKALPVQAAAPNLKAGWGWSYTFPETQLNALLANKISARPTPVPSTTAGCYYRWVRLTHNTENPFPFEYHCLEQDSNGRQVAVTKWWWRWTGPVTVGWYSPAAGIVYDPYVFVGGGGWVQGDPAQENYGRTDDHGFVEQWCGFDENNWGPNAKFPFANRVGSVFAEEKSKSLFPLLATWIFVCREKNESTNPPAPPAQFPADEPYSDGRDRDEWDKPYDPRAEEDQDRLGLVFSTGWSNHANGRGIDFTIPKTAAGAWDTEYGNRFVDWLLGEMQGEIGYVANRLGADQIIFNRHAWDPVKYPADKKVSRAADMRFWQDYGEHDNHIHVTISWTRADTPPEKWWNQGSEGWEQDYPYMLAAVTQLLVPPFSPGGEEANLVGVADVLVRLGFVQGTGTAWEKAVAAGYFSSIQNPTGHVTFDELGRAFRIANIELGVSGASRVKWHELARIVNDLVLCPAGSPVDVLIGKWSGETHDSPGLYCRETREFVGPGAERGVFGKVGDVPLVGDWIGDGKDGIGVRRPSDNYFHLRETATSTDSFQYGRTGDVAIIGNWAGTSESETGLYRPSDTPSERYFYLRKPDGSLFQWPWQYGTAAAIPLVGDWDGDGYHDVGVYEPSNMTFYLRMPNGALNSLVYGKSGDSPLIGDWDGDGRDEIGVFRPKELAQEFHLRSSLGGNYLIFGMGRPGDVPIVGDWDGNGADQVGVFRPSNHTFYMRHTFTPDDNSLTEFRPKVGSYVSGQTATPSTTTTVPVAPTTTTTRATTTTTRATTTTTTLPCPGESVVQFAGSWTAGPAERGGYYCPTSLKFVRDSQPTQVFGRAGDKPLIGAWNTAGIDEIGVYRASDLKFYLRNPAGPAVEIGFGRSGDLPLVGDWNADGKDEIGVRRLSDLSFHLRKTATVTDSFGYGRSTDVAIIGRWKDSSDVATGLYRSSNRYFYLRKTNGTLHQWSWPYGTAAAIPLVGDWDGDGHHEVGVYEPSNMTFYLRMPNETLKSLIFGRSGDLPIVGDWDGDGDDEIGVYRPSTGEFHYRPNLS